jgi:hypothetical protein
MTSGFVPSQCPTPSAVCAANQRVMAAQVTATTASPINRIIVFPVQSTPLRCILTIAPVVEVSRSRLSWCQVIPDQIKPLITEQLAVARIVRVERRPEFLLKQSNAAVCRFDDILTCNSSLAAET